MAEQSLKVKTAKGTIWSAIEKISGQGIQFLVTIVIARILTPKDFGLIGMMAVFIAIAQALVDGGFSQALIRKQDRTEVDNSTIFFFNIFISLILYLILFLVAPWVSEFYNEPQLTVLMRVLCLVVIINSFGAIQRTLLTVFIDFKTQAKASLIASLLSGGIGIYLAYHGVGVWSLIFQQLIFALVNVVLLWFFSKWRPLFVYSWNSFKKLFAFGSNLLISTLINTIYGNLYQIVIGRIFSATSLGHFTQANQISNLPSANLTGILDRVTYPVLSNIQDDDERLTRNYRKILRTSAFIVFPLMCGLAAISYPLVRFILGDQWLYTATLMVPLCFSLMWYPVHAINLDLLKVKGRSDLFLKLEIIKKVIGVFILALSIPFGLSFMCWMSILSSLISLAINTYYTSKLINVSFISQMRDLLPSLLCSIVVYAVSYATTKTVTPDFLQLILACVTGIASFTCLTCFFKLKELSYLKSIITTK